VIRHGADDAAVLNLQLLRVRSTSPRQINLKMGITMSDAEVIYVVRFWVKPEAQSEILGWLRDKHLAEVLAQPGFLSAELCDLREQDGSGWGAYFILYRLSSADKFQAYMKSDAKARFNREQNEFSKVLRAERLTGFVSDRFLS